MAVLLNLLGMFVPALNFLRSPLGKVALGAGAVVAVVIGFNIWLSNHDKELSDRLLAEFNLQQQEAARKQQEEFDKKLNEVLLSQEESLSRVREERDRQARAAKNLIEQLREKNLEGGEASPVLRGAIELLEKRRSD